MTNESKRDWQELLKPEDFASKAGDNPWNELGDIRKWASEIANEIIRNELKKAPRVYARNVITNHENTSEWSVLDVLLDTHSAKLICIEEIKRD